MRRYRDALHKAMMEQGHGDDPGGTGEGHEPFTRCLVLTWPGR